MADLKTKYPDTTNCFQLEKQIDQIVAEHYHESVKFNSGYAWELEELLYKKRAIKKGLNCEAVIQNEKLKTTASILNKYSATTTQEVTGESKKTRNMYVFIAGVTFVLGSLILIYNSKTLSK